jgi:DNA uptake protein ComE-like DNA-binding protein
MNEHSTSAARESARDPGRDVLRCVYALVFVLLSGALAMYATRSPLPRAAGGQVAGPAVRGVRIDPNVAEWAELAALPGLGEVIAKRIVSYRESQPRGTPVFRCSEDLMAVKGIGLKKSTQLAPFLRFARADADASPSRP